MKHLGAATLKTEAGAGHPADHLSNYARLGGNLILGLVLVAFMLGWIRNDAVAVVSLLGAGSGFAAMFREITVRARHQAGLPAASAPLRRPRPLPDDLQLGPPDQQRGRKGVVLIGFAILFYLVHSHFFDIGQALDARGVRSSS